MNEEITNITNTRLKSQSVISYYMDLMEDSNCICDLESNKNLFYTFDDETFRFLSKVNDVEETFYDIFPAFFSNSIKEKLGIGYFNFVYWNFKK